MSLQTTRDIISNLDQKADNSIQMIFEIMHTVTKDVSNEGGKMTIQEQLDNFLLIGKLANEANEAKASHKMLNSIVDRVAKLS